jgi:hypothetical protein
MQNTTAPCSVCGEGGHRASCCPTLREPLKEGFYSGGGGGGGHSHDDEEGISEPVMCCVSDDGAATDETDRL